MITLLIPFAPQKAFWAKGRSFEMQRTVVFCHPADSLLIFLTDREHIPVMTLGKIFMIKNLPVNFADGHIRAGEREIGSFECLLTLEYLPCVWAFLLR